MNQPGKQQPAVSHANPGDEVYFRKGGQPASGKVVCAGRHGCTLEHGGKQHKVQWEHVLGHKKRAAMRYHVEEEGEDGLIVRDQHGRRQFVGIPPEAKEHRLEVAKNKPDRP
jgi:hypothetical protein